LLTFQRYLVLPSSGRWNHWIKNIHKTCV
jgi:hypothetical protein